MGIEELKKKALERIRNRPLNQKRWGYRMDSLISAAVEAHTISLLDEAYEADWVDDTALHINKICRMMDERETKTLESFDRNAAFRESVNQDFTEAFRSGVDLFLSCHEDDQQPQILAMAERLTSEKVLRSCIEKFLPDLVSALSSTPMGSGSSA